MDSCLGGKVWQLTIKGKEKYIFWIGVICASVIVKLLTIFSFIVRLLWIYGLWILVYLEYVWVMPKFVIELLACWQGLFGCHHNGYIRIIVPHCLMWCIWKERNSRCCEDSERSMPDLKLFFFRTLLDWLSMWRNQSFSSILDLLDLWIFCIWYVHPCILLVNLGVSFLISINLYYL